MFIEIDVINDGIQLVNTNLIGRVFRDPKEIGVTLIALDTTELQQIGPKQVAPVPVTLRTKTSYAEITALCCDSNKPGVYMGG